MSKRVCSWLGWLYENLISLDFRVNVSSNCPEMRCPKIFHLRPAMFHQYVKEVSYMQNRNLTLKVRFKYSSGCSSGRLRWRWINLGHLRQDDLTWRSTDLIRKSQRFRIINCRCEVNSSPSRSKDTRYYMDNSSSRYWETDYTVCI